MTDTNRFYFAAEIACANEDDGCEARASISVALPSVLDINSVPDSRRLFDADIPDGWHHLVASFQSYRTGVHCPACTKDPYRFEEDDEGEDDD